MDTHHHHHQHSSFADGNSARNLLVPRAQVLDVLKNLNIREGLFNEEELRELENGFSVSDTTSSNNNDTGRNQNDEISSQHSSRAGGISQRHFSQGEALGFNSLYVGGRGVGANSVQHGLQPRHAAGPGGATNFDLESKVRFEQHKMALESEVQALKQRQARKLAQVERQLDQARADKREMQLMLENQKQVFRAQAQQQEARTADQLREIREQQRSLQGQVPQFREKLDAYKREFAAGGGSLVVGEESYVELKAKPEDQLSLKEFLQVKVYEQLDRYRSEIETLRRENDELVEQSLALQHRAERDSRENEALKKLSRDREEDARRRIDTAERRTRELEADLARVSSQHKVLFERGLNQKDSEGRLRELEVDARTLETRSRQLEEQLAKAQDARQEAEKRADGLRREIDILSQDKSFLQRESSSLEERLKRSEDKVDRLDSELLDAKRSAQKYLERVLQTSDDVKGKFEREYAQELTDLKDRHTRELESAKNHLVDIYERRVDHLRERAEELERRNAKLEMDLRDRTLSYDELMVELRSLQKQCDEEIGRLKLAVLSRGDELQRVTHLYEDNLSLVKELRLENEGLRQKQEVLRTEYYRLEGLHREGTADVRAELAVCKERLAQYELIEKELDQAIVHVANGDGADSGENAVGNALIATITQAPTAAKRRIQQSLLLANRLQTKQKENEQLQHEIKILKEKVEAQEGEGRLQKRLLERASQPHSYIMADVERAERELAAAQKKLKSQDEELKRYKKDIESLTIQKRGLQEDLQRLLGKRSEIEALQTTLQSLLAHGGNKKLDVDDLKSKLAESFGGRKAAMGKTANGSTLDMSLGSATNNGYHYQSKENVSLNQQRRKSLGGGRSKSPGHGLFEELPERGSAVKADSYGGEPSWYKALKKNIK